MIRQYGFRQLMLMLTDDKCFVMRQGERYFFATIAR